MALTRSALLKDLLPGLNELFGMEYKIEVGTLRVIALPSNLYQVFSWDGKAWVDVGDPVSKKEAEAMLNVSK